MAAGFQENKGRVFQKICSKLLELAATDDLSGFIFMVEERGSDVNELGFWYGRSFGSKTMGFEERTPVMVASLYGSTKVLEYIIGTGKVDVNKACGSDGATALHCAAAGGSWSSVEVVKLLIDASGDIDALDAIGKKPCELIAPNVKASGSFKRKVLEMLLSGCNGDVGGVEEEGSRTLRPLNSVCEKKDYPIDVSLPDINNGIYGTDEFRMYNFKVKPCSRAYSHDWTECPFVHPGENARRRDPRKYHYTCVPCPEFKKGSCAKGDACEFAHGVFESWLHPAQYRTRLCKDEIGCSRKVCFFAHKPEELRPLYASTGSAMPSPKSAPVSSLDFTTMSPLSLGSPTPSNMSPSVTCSSSMGGSMWQNKIGLTPPMLQLPGSRLKASLSARDFSLDMELLELDKIRAHHHQQQQQQLLEEISSLSSLYRDLKPTNLDNDFGSFDLSLLSQLQGLSPMMNSSSSSNLQSPTGHQILQNANQLRPRYPSNIASSPTRKPSAFGFDSSPAIMNSRSSAFANRSQSFIDRSGTSYRSGISGSANSLSLNPSKLNNWSSPDGKLDWGLNGEEVNKLRKSASFGYRSGYNSTASATTTPLNSHEPDVTWVNSLVRDGSRLDSRIYSTEKNHEHIQDAAPQHWVDQVYVEQEQLVA